MFTRSLIACALLSALVTGACAEPEAPTCTGTVVHLTTDTKLTVAADYNYPPFAFRGPDGGLIGYDVDVAKAVGAEMKLETTFVNRGSGALIAGALAHRHDLAASGIRADDDLREETCVSASYLDADLGVLIRAADKEKIKTVSDLDGRTVAVLEGGRAERWARDKAGDSTIATVPAPDDVLAAVRGGQADAAIDEWAMVRFAAKSTPDLVGAARIPTGESFVLVAAPDNAALLGEVDDALGKLRTNGTLRKLQRKWFG